MLLVALAADVTAAVASRQASVTTITCTGRARTSGWRAAASRQAPAHTALVA